MWFKQVQLFQLTTPMTHSVEELTHRLAPLEFRACLPSLPSSMGWVSPVEEEGAPLVRYLNGCYMVCLQIEEKILPASVIGQTLKEKIKQLETVEARKVGRKEKVTYKEEITHTLLPRAFSKLTRLYAYFDTKNNWLLLNTISPAKTELFMTMFKKSFGDVSAAFELLKPSSVFTRWLKDKDYPDVFSIEKACVLQDPNQQNRMIRCQQQDLFAPSIQSLVKDGCEVIQLGLCWQDRLNFVLAEDFSLRSIKRTEDDLAEIEEITESKAQKLDAYFFMMIEMYSGLIKDLLTVFISKKQELSRVA
jgi:recombination associated protein RdgC